MPPEWIIAGLVSIIATLSGAVGYLWRLHLKDDAVRDADLERSKGATATALENAAALVPAVSALTTAVEGIDARADARYDGIQKLAGQQHRAVIKALRAKQQP